MPEKPSVVFCGDRSISGQGFMMRESIHDIEKYENAYFLKIMDSSIKYFQKSKNKKVRVINKDLNCLASLSP